METSNNKLAQKLIYRINRLQIATKFKQSLINDINKELLKANSIGESIDNNFINETELFISECQIKQVKLNNHYEF